MGNRTFNGAVTATDRLGHGGGGRPGVSGQDALVRMVRRLLNALGVDIVRYRPNQRSASKRGARRPKSVKPLRINIGGGDRDYGPEWHNIEFVTPGYSDKYRNLPDHTDIAHDLSGMLPFPIGDGTLKAAYTSHVIEHLKDEPVQFMFDDVYRTLQPGGRFRISCPDISLYVRAFLERDLGFFHYRNDHPHYAEMGIVDSLPGLFLDVLSTGKHAAGFSDEQVRAILQQKGRAEALDYFSGLVTYHRERSHYHVNWFDEDKIIDMLRKAGFEEVYPSALGQSFVPEMRDLSVFDTGDPKISLFVECRKTGSKDPVLHRGS